MKKLFLCHYSGDAGDVYKLSQELRLHGIIPWMDKEGGFFIGDSAPDTARRVIREDCFGLLLYATQDIFDRAFIKNVEINEAVHVYEENNNFLLVAIPCNLDFNTLSKKSIESFGIDLSQFHTLNINRSNQLGDKGFDTQFVDVARQILELYIYQSNTQNSQGKVSFQFSTREILPNNEGDILLVDGTSLLKNKADLGLQSNWERIANDLNDIKMTLAKIYGRPCLLIHGSTHLTAAYLLGKIFSRPSGFNLEIRQRDEYWSTDCKPSNRNPLNVSEMGGSASSNQLFVEISVTGKMVGDSVRRFIRSTGLYPHRFVSFSPKGGSDRVDNALGISIALQIRETLAQMISRYPISEIHIFSAVPQGLAVLIGHNLNAFPPIQLYEFDGVNYLPSYKIL